MSEVQYLRVKVATLEKRLKRYKSYLRCERRRHGETVEIYERIIKTEYVRK